MKSIKNIKYQNLDFYPCIIILKCLKHKIYIQQEVNRYLTKTNQIYIHIIVLSTIQLDHPLFISFQIQNENG